MTKTARAGLVVFALAALLNSGSAGAAPPTTTVDVVNTTPIPVNVGNVVVVRDSDSPARNGFTAFARNSTSTGNLYLPIYQVASGQLGVVESTSVSVWVDHGFPVFVKMSNGINRASIPCALQGSAVLGISQNVSESTDNYVCDTSMRMYLPGGEVDVQIEASIQNGVNPTPAYLDAEATMSGYAVSQ